MLRTPTTARPGALEDLIDSALIAKVGGLDVASRKVFSGKLKGERRSKKRGQSVEFADHRPYVTGDDTRHIDWNIFGRLDKLFLKMFLEEEDLALHVVIDASESSDCGEPSKFAFMQKAATALGYVGLVNLNRVAATYIGGVSVNAGGGEGSPPSPSRIPEGVAESSRPTEAGLVRAIRDLRGRRRTHDLSRFMCSVRPGGPIDFRGACERIALTRRGKGIMVVFSDFFFKEGYEAGLRMLVGHGYDLFCIQVLSPQEIDPPITGDLRLKDVEDADLTEVTISAPLLKRYKANLAAYCDELRQFCSRRDINFMTIPSSTPIETLLLDYLRKRGMLR